MKSTILAKGSKTPPLVAIHAANKELLDRYDEGLYEIYLKLYDKGADLRRRGLDYYWELGKEFATRVASGKSRAHAASEIANALGSALRLSEGDVRIATKFYAVFPSEKIRDELKALNNAHGEGLSWSHIRRLVDVDDEKEREKLLQLTLKNSWTVEELNAKLAATLNTREAGGQRTVTPRTGGAPVRVPKSIHAALAKFSSMAKTFLANVKEVYANQGLIAQLAAVDEVDPDVINEVDQQLALIKEFTGRLPDTEAWFKALKKELTGKAKAAAAAADDDDDATDETTEDEELATAGDDEEDDELNAASDDEEEDEEEADADEADDSDEEDDADEDDEEDSDTDDSDEDDEEERKRTLSRKKAKPSTRPVGPAKKEKRREDIKAQYAALQASKQRRAKS